MKKELIVNLVLGLLIIVYEVWMLFFSDIHAGYYSFKDAYVSIIVIGIIGYNTWQHFNNENTVVNHNHSLPALFIFIVYLNRPFAQIVLNQSHIDVYLGILLWIVAAYLVVIRYQHNRLFTFSNTRPYLYALLIILVYLFVSGLETLVTFSSTFWIIIERPFSFENMILILYQSMVFFALFFPLILFFRLDFNHSRVFKILNIITIFSLFSFAFLNLLIYYRYLSISLFDISAMLIFLSKIMTVPLIHGFLLIALYMNIGLKGTTRLINKEKYMAILARENSTGKL